MPTPVAAYRPKLSASPSPPDSLLTSLLAWYRNNGTDHSGNGNDLAAVGSPGTAAGLGGVAGAAMSLSDSSGYFGTNPDSGQIFSMAGWFKYSATPDETQYAMRLGASGDPGDVVDSLGYNLAHQADYNSTGVGFLAEGGSAPGTNWTHLVMTVSESELKLWVNGVVVQTTAVSGVRTAPLVLSVGQTTYLTAAQHLGLWSRDLTPAEISRLYASGAGFDPTA